MKPRIYTYIKVLEWRKSKFAMVGYFALSVPSKTRREYQIGLITKA
ncbi:MAG: hypothetical protein M3286_07365 [Thermoproteota archaeon]|nr:hypothetical protein [Thermoproteota archaeon]